MASAAPPPLKKRRREESNDFGLEPPGLDLSGIMAAVDNAPHDDDATKGEWVFKQDDVVLGPVSSSVLVQRIEQGGLSEQTPVGREAGKWRPLKAVPYFQEILDKAERRRRAIAEQTAREAAQRKERALRVVAMAALVAMPLLVGVVTGRAVMVARPWDDTDSWLQRAPPLVDVPPKPKEAPPPPPVVAKADEEPGAAEPGSGHEIENEGDKKTAKARASGPGGGKKKAPNKRAQQQKSTPEEPKAQPAQPETDAALSQQQIMAPVMKNQGPIGGCLKAETARNPEMPARVTLMWTVTEKGRAINFQLKERQVREGPLPACLTKVFDGMRWPRFRGERKNVELPLSVKK
jgi:hypothetical protein